MSVTDEVVLHTMAQSRGIVIHWMLEELGAPYRIRYLDAEAGENRAPEFLALNPMGKVPVIEHRGVAISELAAICAYLADAFAEAGLSVAIAEPRRGVYLQWLFFGPGCLEPAIAEKMFKREPIPETMAGFGSYERVMAVLDTALADQPYLMGDGFTAADVVIGANLIWGTMMGAVDGTPVIRDYIARLEARPAFGRAMAPMVAT